MNAAMCHATPRIYCSLSTVGINFLDEYLYSPVVGSFRHVYLTLSWPHTLSSKTAHHPSTIIIAAAAAKYLEPLTRCCGLKYLCRHSVAFVSGDRGFTLLIENHAKG